MAFRLTLLHCKQTCPLTGACGAMYPGQCNETFLAQLNHTFSYAFSLLPHNVEESFYMKDNLTKLDTIKLGLTVVRQASHAFQFVTFHFRLYQCNIHENFVEKYVKGQCHPQTLGIHLYKWLRGVTLGNRNVQDYPRLTFVSCRIFGKCFARFTWACGWYKSHRLSFNPYS